MATTTTTIRNGVDVAKLAESIATLRQDPELARFKFRVSNRWLDGGHSRIWVNNYYGLGAEDTDRKEPHVLDADEPPALLGRDAGPNPVEYALTALAGCMTASMAYHAASRGIVIESLESTLEGDLDLQGFLGLRDDVRPGYQEVRVTFQVKSDASPEQLEELARRSPVLDVFASPVPVHIRIEKK